MIKLLGFEKSYLTQSKQPTTRHLQKGNKNMTKQLVVFKQVNGNEWTIDREIQLYNQKLTVLVLMVHRYKITWKTLEEATAYVEHNI